MSKENNVSVVWSLDDGYGQLKIYNGFSESIAIPSFYTDKHYAFDNKNKSLFTGQSQRRLIRLSTLRSQSMVFLT